MIQSIKKHFQRNLKVYVEEAGVEKYLGTTAEDGVTLTFNFEDFTVKNGEVRTIIEIYKYMESVTAEFSIMEFDVETLTTSMPGVEATGTGADSVLRFKSKAIKLKDHATKFVFRPVGMEDDDSQKITLPLAANNTNNTFTFKTDEVTNVAFNLFGFADANGDHIVIGDDSVV